MRHASHQSNLNHYFAIVSEPHTATVMAEVRATARLRAQERLRQNVPGHFALPLTVPLLRVPSPTPQRQPAVREVLPKAGLLHSEKGNLVEVLCKPKIMPIKVSLAAFRWCRGLSQRRSAHVTCAGRQRAAVVSSRTPDPNGVSSERNCGKRGSEGLILAAVL